MSKNKSTTPTVNPMASRKRRQQRQGLGSRDVLCLEHLVCLLCFMLFYSTNKVFTRTRHVQTTTNTTLTPKDPCRHHHLHDASTCRKTSPPPQRRVQWHHKNSGRGSGLGTRCVSSIGYVDDTAMTRTLGGREGTTRKNGPRDVSWATVCFFFLFHFVYLLLTPFFRCLLKLLQRLPTTLHPPP